MCVLESERERKRDKEWNRGRKRGREKDINIYIEREINRQRERKKEIVRWIDGVVDMYSVKGKKMYEKIKTSSHPYIMITNGWKNKCYMSVLKNKKIVFWQTNYFLDNVFFLSFFFTWVLPLFLRLFLSLSLFQSLSLSNTHIFSFSLYLFILSLIYRLPSLLLKLFLPNPFKPYSSFSFFCYLNRFFFFIFRILKLLCYDCY